MFFYKNVYVEIPNDIKVFYGDNWIFDNAKRNGYDNYKILGQEIYHLGSISSASLNINQIAKSDCKIYKRLTIKWYHRLFSFEENSDAYKLRLLGITFRFKKSDVNINFNDYIYYNRRN